MSLSIFPWQVKIRMCIRSTCDAWIGPSWCVSAVQLKYDCIKVESIHAQSRGHNSVVYFARLWMLQVHKDHVGAVMDISYSPTGREFVSGAVAAVAIASIDTKHRPQLLLYVFSLVHGYRSLAATTEPCGYGVLTRASRVKSTPLNACSVSLL